MARIANFCVKAGFMQLICTRVYILQKQTYCNRRQKCLEFVKNIGIKTVERHHLRAI